MTVSEEATGRTLAACPLQQPEMEPMTDRHLLFPETTRVVGITGDKATARFLGVGFRLANFESGFVDAMRLPEVADGYDAVDVLVLNGGNWGAVTVPRQQAIIDWVRAGGVLVAWLGEGPRPTRSPLLDLLPAQVGDPREERLGADDAAAAGLAGEPVRFTAYSQQPKADAETFNLFSTLPNVKGSRRRVGLGWTVLLSTDVSSLHWRNDGATGSFWRMFYPRG